MALVPKPLRIGVADSWEMTRKRLAIFVEEVRNALSGKLTIAENMAAEIKEIEWTGGRTDQPVSSTLKVPVYGAIMLWVREENGAAVSTSFMDWEPAGVNGTNGINIRTISGLTADASYRVRLLLLGG